MPYVTTSWLAEHAEIPPATTAAQLAADLVAVGLEEEEIIPPAVTGPLVVGKVLSLEAETHSNGKTVNYCRVDVGTHNDQPGEGREPAEVASRGIVCGAHNFKAGDHVVVALPGTTLPGNFAISARKTYGHISDGMICSATELGLEGDASGIIVLDDMLADAPPAPGTDAIALLGLGEEVLEINVTPDRGYCFSMRGVAREYALSTGARYTDPVTTITPAQAGGNAFEVHLDDDAPLRGQAGCLRFVTRVVRGIDPQAPSPAWMQRRLTHAGMRPISLIVDVTNYVMLDLGQPIHAYDLGAVEGPIVVRRARTGETLTTLDDVERKLDPEDLLITDSQGARGERVLGLAGVMGGASTEVGPQTSQVLIEAAYFSPISIGRTARRHKLPSEASKRFERGVDPALAPFAAQRVVELLVEYGGGQADEDAVGDVGHWQDALPAALEVTPEQVTRLIGVTYDDDRVAELLTAIGCEVQRGETWTVTPPSWRPDLVGAAHLAEEVARLDGYDKIPYALPPQQLGAGPTVAQRRRRDVMRTVTEAGLVEVLTFPFVGDAHDRQRLAGDDPRRVTMNIRNPIADSAPALRTSVLDTLLPAAQLNVARASGTLALVESGMVTHPRPGAPSHIDPVGVDQRPGQDALDGLAAVVPDQPHHLAGVLGGQQVAKGPHAEPHGADWADAIDIVRRAAAVCGAPIEVRQGHAMPWHPGRCAEIRLDGEIIGYAGELHPEVVADYQLPVRSAAFEVDLDALCAAPTDPIRPRAISSFPAAKEDLAFVVPEELSAAQLGQALANAVGEHLEDLHLFDVYRGPQVGEGRKSLAFALRLRGAEATLTADDIAAARERAVKAAAELQGELRA